MHCREQGAIHFVYGTPNDKARAIVERAGLRVLGTLTRYTKVIRSMSYWRDRLPRWVVPSVAIAVDALIACADISRGWMYGRDWLWSEHANFGPELEKIWQGRDVDVIIGERRPPVLGWRYSSFDPDSPWHISLATDSSSAPLGYVVWRRRNGIAMVSDFFCINASRSTRALLQSFASYIRQFPVDRLSLEFFGLSSVVAALTACGFVARDRSPIVVIAHTDEELHAVSLSSNGIYMTSFDRDHDDRRRRSTANTTITRGGNGPMTHDRPSTGPDTHLATYTPIRVLSVDVWAWGSTSAVLLAMYLYPGFAPETGQDSFQYFSVAQNALDGRFAYTSLVHFDAERSFGVIPALVGDFPPGIPVHTGAREFGRALACNVWPTG